MIGYAQNITSKQVVPLTRDLFENATRSHIVTSVCADIADALEKVKRGEMSRDDFNTFKAAQKKRLPIITPHATFRDGIRRDANAISSGFYMLDLDHVSDPAGLWKVKSEELRVKNPKLLDSILLAHVTPSGEGLRLVAVIPTPTLPKGGSSEPHGTPLPLGGDGGRLSIPEAQAWLAHELGGIDYDPSTKDLARSSFLVPRDYILHLSDELFSRRPDTHPQPLPKGGVSHAVSHAVPHADAAPLPSGGAGGGFKGIPYASIIARYWEKTGGEPTQGERNVKLHKLACNLRAICDNSPQWLMQVMPRLGLSESELDALCKSACKEPVKGSRIIDEIVRSLSPQPPLHGEGEDMLQDEEDDKTIGKANHSPLLGEGRGVRLPRALKASLAGVPQSLHFPVIAAVLPIAGALADQVEVEYCDGQRQRLSLMSIILGNQASGKSVCKQVVDIWKRPLEREDADARRIEDEWKEKKKHRKANERCPEDPKVMIRVLPVTVSCSTLLKRLKNSRDHTLYSFGEELDTLRKTNGAGSWSSKYDIYRLGFDHGEWGQDYNSDQAESGTVNVAYNWTMLGTYGALKRCFSKDNVENGLSSRVLVAEMPDNSFAPMPRYGRRTSAHEAAILEGVGRLRSACGFIDTPRLRKAIGEWVEEKRVEAMADIDRVKDTYRKRAAVIGFRAGVICHLLSGDERESKATLQFATAIAELTLRGQMSVFGEALAKQLDEDPPQKTGCNTGVFERLPELFTMGDIRQLKRGLCTNTSLRMIVSRWGKAGWTEKVDASHWRKCNIVTL